VFVVGVGRWMDSGGKRRADGDDQVLDVTVACRTTLQSLFEELGGSGAGLTRRQMGNGGGF
jgi:hypothetical protein